MTTKENFIKRYNDIKEDVVKAINDALTRATENEALDYESMVDNYSDVYPLIGAALQREIQHCLEGSSYEHVKRKQKQQAAKYRGDHRIWHDYAGDYHTKNKQRQ